MLLLRQWQQLRRKHLRVQLREQQQLQLRRLLLLRRRRKQLLLLRRKQLLLRWKYLQLQLQQQLRSCLRLRRQLLLISQGTYEAPAPQARGLFLQARILL